MYWIPVPHTWGDRNHRSSLCFRCIVPWFIIINARRHIIFTSTGIVEGGTSVLGILTVQPFLYKVTATEIIPETKLIIQLLSTLLEEGYHPYRRSVSLLFRIVGIVCLGIRHWHCCRILTSCCTVCNDSVHPLMFPIEAMAGDMQVRRSAKMLTFLIIDSFIKIIIEFWVVIKRYYWIL
ncbi:hypothetical protein SAMN04487902_103130 [Prevotella sp. ne3005]|nr:hypothetical protein SAMN04487902_103130 [Prevotella sp. ne3005]